jgi:hypothetical protein
MRITTYTFAVGLIAIILAMAATNETFVDCVCHAFKPAVKAPYTRPAPRFSEPYGHNWGFNMKP